jgi:hypothetical protein
MAEINGGFDRKSGGGESVFGGVFLVDVLVVKELWLLNRQGPGVVVQFLKETTLVARVTGSGGLLDLEEEDVSVAVDEPSKNALGVPAGLTFEPESGARAAPVGHQAGAEGIFEGLAVHPCEHENAAGRPRGGGGFLDDDGNEPVLVKFEIKFHGIASEQNLSIIANCR